MTEENQDTTPKPRQEKARNTQRDTALAQRLRANLARRKAAQRARGDSASDSKPE